MKTLILKATKTESNALKIGKPHDLRLVEGENTVSDSVDLAAVAAIAKANGFTVTEVVPEPVAEDRPVVEVQSRSRRNRDEAQPLDIPAEG